MLRLAGHVHAHQMHRGADAIAREVVLGEPHGIVACFVHDRDALHGPCVDGRQWDAPLWPTEELENSKFHGGMFLYEPSIV
jgi:hypothetical protein